MKKYLILISIAVLSSCSTTNVVKKTDKPKQLYEILTQQSQGGASIRFYEILTESDEIAMLQNDENLSGKIQSEDLKSASFIILNMGEKPTAGYSITVSSVIETDDKILVKVNENDPEPGSMNAMVITNPYTIVKINSKKEIVIE